MRFLACAVCVVVLVACKTLGGPKGSSSQLQGLYDDEKILLLVGVEGQEGLYEFVVCYCLDVTAPRTGECVRAFRTSTGLFPLFRLKSMEVAAQVGADLKAAEENLYENLDVQHAVAGAVLRRHNYILQEILDPSVGKLVHSQIIAVGDIPKAVVKADDGVRGVVKTSSGNSVIVKVAEGKAGDLAKVEGISSLVRARRDSAISMQTFEQYAARTSQSLRDEIARLAVSSDEQSKMLLKLLKMHMNVDATGDALVDQLTRKMLNQPDIGLRVLERSGESLAHATVSLSDDMKALARAANQVPVEKQMDVLLPKLNAFLDTIKSFNGRALPAEHVRRLGEWRAVMASKVGELKYKHGITEIGETVMTSLVRLADASKLQPVVVPVQVTVVKPMQTMKELLSVRTIQIRDAAEAVARAAKTGRPLSEIAGGAGRAVDLGQTGQKAADDVAAAVVSGSRYTELAKLGRKGGGRIAGIAALIAAAAVGGGWIWNRFVGAGFVGNSQPLSGQGVSLVIDDDSADSIPILHIPHPDTPEGLLSQEFNNVQMLADNWSDIANLTPNNDLKVNSVEDILAAMVRHFDPAGGGSTSRGAGFITDYCVPSFTSGSLASACTQVIAPD